MPRSTPKVKQNAVFHHGGSFVEIILSGDSYDEAVGAAKADMLVSGAVYVHAYDDLHVMAGQGTLADEIVLSGHGPFDAAFLQVGGGGLAAAVADWLKTYWPSIEIVGVEGVGQASMKAALAAGKPVDISHADIFCDGTAVRKVGELPFQICKDQLARVDTVTNAEVSAAMRVLWEGLRCVSEPSGAMGLAAVMKRREELAGKRVVIVISGANVDFLQLGIIAQSVSGVAEHSRTVRVRIAERPGSMLELLDGCFAGLNIIDFQYGKTHDTEAWPVFTLSADDAETLTQLPSRLAAQGLEWQELTDAVDVNFRAISLRSALLRNPVFLRLDFYERPGALHDFLDRMVRDRADICYFNYRQSGERVGRALIGLDFPAPEAREAFLSSLPKQDKGYRSCTAVDSATCSRLLGQ